MHVFSIYSAGVLLKNYEELLALSKNMLKNTIKLEQELQTNGLSVVQSCPPALQHLHTHHLWIQAYNKEEAFNWYLTLEKNRYTCKLSKASIQLRLWIKVRSICSNLLRIMSRRYS